MPLIEPQQPEPRLIVDMHLDLAMNAIEWNRDLTRSIDEIRAREEGLTDKPDRGHGTVCFPEMRRADGHPTPPQPAVDRRRIAGRCQVSLRQQGQSTVALLVEGHRSSPVRLHSIERNRPAEPDAASRAE